jgi:hypothetical protein
VDSRNHGGELLKQLKYYYPGNPTCPLGDRFTEGTLLHVINKKFLKHGESFEATMLAAADYARHHYVRDEQRIKVFTLLS